jgi:hypothetical protein
LGTDFPANRERPLTWKCCFRATPALTAQRLRRAVLRRFVRLDLIDDAHGAGMLTCAAPIAFGGAGDFVLYMP